MISKKLVATILNSTDYMWVAICCPDCVLSQLFGCNPFWINHWSELLVDL